MVPVIKRHIAVDTRGQAPCDATATAEVTDRNGALEAIDRWKKNLEWVERNETQIPS